MKAIRISAIRVLVPALLLLAAPLCAEPIEFHHALELALKHSGTMKAARADRVKAAEHYRAERYNYVPTVVFGSGAGYSTGVAISLAGQVPSIFNITHSQAVYNPSLQQTIKAAHSDSIAADLDYNDRADQVVLDTALVYIELDNTLQRLATAREQKHAVEQALFIAQQREQEGVSAPVDTKRAELDLAKVELRIADLETSADLLREHLGRSIGVEPAALETVSSSIPAAPPIRTEDDLASVALANSISVRVADEHVRAARARARAQHLTRYPSLDFSGQYSELAPYLNYGLNPATFTTHDYSFGINLKIPIFNLAGSAEAAAADAEALRAEADAQILRDQVASDAVRAQHSLHQLQAQLKVSRLEAEVAEANIDAVSVQMQSGHASVRDEEMARAGLADRRLLLLQTQFDYLRAQLQLLRQTGELRTWALGRSQP